MTGQTEVKSRGEEILGKLNTPKKKSPSEAAIHPHRWPTRDKQRHAAAREQDPPRRHRI